MLVGLKPGRLAAGGPIEFMAQIEHSLDDPAYNDLASSIATGLAFCIVEAPEQPEAFERAERLPLARARREAKAWSQASPRDVGRGLADARARGKTILRLRVAPRAAWRVRLLAKGSSLSRKKLAFFPQG